jgi:hypothetical protein
MEKFKRFLFLLTSDSEVKEIIKFSKSLKEKFGDNIENDLVYVKDLELYEKLPLTIQGLGVNNNTIDLIKEYRAIENEKYDEYYSQIKPYFRKVYALEGTILDVALEELKAYDLLVICKNEGNRLSDNLNSLLKHQYKPLIILSNTDKDYSFEKILMLNDGGYKVNTSVYQYFNIFGCMDIDVLRVNVEDENRLVERFGSQCNIIDKSGDPASIILELDSKYDMLLMGNLRYSLLIGKLTGQVGVKVLENTKTPIFIG